MLIKLRPEPWTIQPSGSYNQNALIRKATNEFVSFCIDNGMLNVRCDVEIVSSSKIGMRLASPFTVIFFQTIFNISHLLTIAFSAKNMCNKKKFSSLLGGRRGGGNAPTRVTAKKIGHPCDIARANSSNIALKLRSVVKSATKIAPTHCHKNESV